MWFCRCECGNVRSVIAQALINKKSTKCNECKYKERKVDSIRLVNGRRTATYQTWDAIKHRCLYESQASYLNYGNRGIGICEEWKNSYDAFYEYVSQLEHFGEEGMTIDRINNEKGYEPGNVRWATRAEQNRHKRNKKEE